MSDGPITLNEIRVTCLVIILNVYSVIILITTISQTPCTTLHPAANMPAQTLADRQRLRDSVVVNRLKARIERSRIEVYLCVILLEVLLRVAHARCILVIGLIIGM